MPTGTTTIGINNSSVMFGNGINFGYDNTYYIINVSIPYGDTSMGGASLYINQNLTQQFLYYGFMSASLFIPELRFIPIK